MNIYDCNDTMKMLGYQVSPMWFNEKVRKDVQDIFDAYWEHIPIKHYNKFQIHVVNHWIRTGR